MTWVWDSPAPNELEYPLKFTAVILLYAWTVGWWVYVSVLPLPKQHPPMDGDVPFREPESWIETQLTGRGNRVAQKHPVWLLSFLTRLDFLTICARVCVKPPPLHSVPRRPIIPRTESPMSVTTSCVPKRTPHFYPFLTKQGSRAATFLQLGFLPKIKPGSSRLRSGSSRLANHPTNEAIVCFFRIRQQMAKSDGLDGNLSDFNVNLILY